MFRYCGEKFRHWALRNSSNGLKILFISFVFTGIGNAQNLVPNPGFEIFKKCPSDYTIRYRKELIPGWYIPSLGTPDYFNSCTNVQVGVPQNFMGYFPPKDGAAYTGIIMLLEPPSGSSKSKPLNYREYLQTCFTRELERDKVYEVTFYYSVASYSTYAINRLGVYISNNKITNRHTSGVLKYAPQMAIDTATVENEKDNWFCFSAKYKARGGERYMTIGNFYDDNHTSYSLCELSGVSSVKKSKILSDRISYYYIDNVSVSEVTAP